ncbi:hypothetical protein B0H11DRAFT_871162 [Mycena galericulata]|nr:hypothetical protein B0H11DRAFT_871162 [Mycena galericulata]
MTTIHENLVPTIPSGTLPQTPAAEWADSVQDSLGAHVTRTPVGTPGPKVPGGWNDEVEPATGDVTDLRTYIPGQEDVQRALDGAKAYLPQGVAAYLPGTGTNSGAVDIGHGASVPYTEGGAQPYSTGVDLGPATGAPYTEGGAEPYGAGAGSDLGRSANATSLNETASALASGAASTLPSAGQTAKAYLPEGVAAYLPGSPSSTSSRRKSVTAVDMGPASSTTYTESGVAPYGADAGAGSDLGRTGTSNASSNAAASLNMTASTLATGAASAGETAKAYVPEGVAGYLRESSTYVLVPFPALRFPFSVFRPTSRLLALPCPFILSFLSSVATCTPPSFPASPVSSTVSPCRLLPLPSLPLPSSGLSLFSVSSICSFSVSSSLFLTRPPPCPCF